MKRFFVFLLVLNSLGCEKPEPHPELGDAIYMDMQSELGITSKAIDDVKKSIDEHKTALDKVKPQTGQIKYASKRYWDDQKTLDTLLQQEKYWKIRISERLQFDRREYLKAFKAKTPWPDPKEFDEYMAEKRLRQAKQAWDSKGRIQKYKTESAPAPGPGTEGPKAEAPE